MTRVRHLFASVYKLCSAGRPVTCGSAWARAEGWGGWGACRFWPFRVLFQENMPQQQCALTLEVFMPGTSLRLACLPVISTPG